MEVSAIANVQYVYYVNRKKLNENMIYILLKWSKCRKQSTDLFLKKKNNIFFLFFFFKNKCIFIISFFVCERVTQSAERIILHESFEIGNGNKFLT